VPLLIVHGGPGLNHSYFLPHLDQLAKKYKLVFYDQRACGRSAIPSTDSISLKFFVDDIEGLRKFLGVEKLNILAHSWGAIPAVDYGILYPDRVGKLILVNPVPLSHEFDALVLDLQKSMATDKDTADRAIVRGSRGFKAGNSDAYKQLLMLSFRHLFYRPENIAKLKIDVPSNFAAGRKALMEGLGKDLEQYNFYESIKSFSFPVLILAGDKDMVPLPALTEMKQNIPYSRLDVFSKSGHFIFIEERRKFTEDVMGFLGKGLIQK
jgi:proline iminopeptidase